MGFRARVRHQFRPSWAPQVSKRSEVLTAALSELERRGAESEGLGFGV